MTSAQMETPTHHLSPDRLLQVGLGFWASKTFLASLKFDLYTQLGERSMSAEEIMAMLGLHPRGTRDFLDALVSLGALERKGSLYSNTPETTAFFSRTSPQYIGGMLEMANERLYEFWGRLEEGLMTGKPQNETRNGGSFFDVMYNDPEKVRIFQQAMIGLSAASSAALVKTFDFSRCEVFCDIGGGPGTLAIQVARSFPHIKVINFDLPQTARVFLDNVTKQGMADSVEFEGGDCLVDPWPAADVYAMGHVLHGWGGHEETHRALKKAYGLLPKGGSFLVVESLIDDDRRHNPFGLLMSLDMLLETEKGRNFTGREIRTWMQEAGFSDVSISPLIGPHSVAIGKKG